MDINELFQKKLAEGCSLGHAQWIVGSRLMDGRGVEKSCEKAEGWLLLAWDNGFPGTARTEAFLLRRIWDRLLDSRFEERPRLRALLKDAVIEAGEKKGCITVHTANDAKAQWLHGRLDDLPEALLALSGGRFQEISVREEKTA